MVVLSITSLTNTIDKTQQNLFTISIFNYKMMTLYMNISLKLEDNLVLGVIKTNSSKFVLHHLHRTLSHNSNNANIVFVADSNSRLRKPITLTWKHCNLTPHINASYFSQFCTHLVPTTQYRHLRTRDHHLPIHETITYQYKSVSNNLLTTSFNLWPHILLSLFGGQYLNFSRV